MAETGYERAEERLDFIPMVTKGCMVVLLSSPLAEPSSRGDRVKLVGQTRLVKRRSFQNRGEGHSEAASRRCVQSSRMGTTHFA